MPSPNTSRSTGRIYATNFARVLPKRIADQDSLALPPRTARFLLCHSRRPCQRAFCGGRLPLDTTGGGRHGHPRCGRWSGHRQLSVGRRAGRRSRSSNSGAEIIAIDGVPIDSICQTKLSLTPPRSARALRTATEAALCRTLAAGQRHDGNLPQPGAAQTWRQRFSRRRPRMKASAVRRSTSGWTASSCRWTIRSRQRLRLCADLQLLRQRTADGPAVGALDSYAQGREYSRSDHRYASERRGQRFPGRSDGGVLFPRSIGTGQHGLVCRETRTISIFDPRTVERFYLPLGDLRYDGAVAVLTGPNCSSACEFFTYDMTLEGTGSDRRSIPHRRHGRQRRRGADAGKRILPVHCRPGVVDTQRRYPRRGQRGGADDPGAGQRAIAASAAEDPILAAAVEYLDNLTAIDVIDGGPLAIGDVVSGRLMPGSTRALYSGTDRRRRHRTLPGGRHRPARHRAARLRSGRQSAGLQRRRREPRDHQLRHPAARHSGRSHAYRRSRQLRRRQGGRFHAQRAARRKVAHDPGKRRHTCG